MKYWAFGNNTDDPELADNASLWDVLRHFGEAQPTEATEGCVRV
jgi:hypothetical protein